MPENRFLPQKCHRCDAKRLPCSDPVRSDPVRSDTIRATGAQGSPPAPASRPDALTSEHRSSSTPLNPAPAHVNRYPISSLLSESNADKPPFPAPLNLRSQSARPSDSRMATAASPTKVSPATRDQPQGWSKHTTNSFTPLNPQKSWVPVINPDVDDEAPVEPPKKRKRQTGDGGESSETDLADEKGQNMACPFYKFDPLTYFRCQHRYQLKRYADVKQHLVRLHTFGPCYCHVCWHDFGRDDRALKEHVQRKSCRPMPGPEALIDEELEQLRNQHRGGSDEKKWYSLWEFLFPGHEPPASHYLKEGILENVPLLKEEAHHALQEKLSTILLRQNILLPDASLPQLRDELVSACFDTASLLQKPRPRRRMPETSKSRQQSRLPPTGNSNPGPFLEPTGTQDKGIPEASAERFLEKLSDQVRAACVSAQDEEVFFPCDKINEFVTDHTVDSALKEEAVTGSEGFTSLILQRAPRTFLILVMMGQVRLLKEFVAYGVNDSALPLGFYQNERDQHWYGYSVEEDARPRKQFTLKNWSFRQCDQFDIYQRRLLAPSLGENDSVVPKIYPKRILPFLKNTEKPQFSVLSGFSGDITEEKLHRSHLFERVVHTFVDLGLRPGEPDGMGVPVVVKEIRNIDLLKDRLGSKNLESLLLHKHQSDFLLRPAASYQIRNSYYLLYPRSEGGHLGNFWEQFPEGPLDPRRVTWIIRQFVGICDALRELHDLNRRHGGLRPDNIIWFPKAKGNGALRMTDLGHVILEKEAFRADPRADTVTLYPSEAYRYEAPEADERSDSEKTRSRAYDVWSLGCVMLELLIWLVSGLEDLKLFQQQTKHSFWKQSPNSAKQEHVLIPRVALWMKVIGQLPTLCPAYRALLNLIRKRLLVVPYHEMPTKPSPDLRASMEEVCSSMASLLNDCEVDFDHLTAPSLSRASRVVLPP
ncbi:unnamed protein product [Clonostachys rosea]|uniref:Protein kinase domain-containing protein n=1 Tax=Bionectria ochroleuca TaxID=29856 RepID=A0ABY6UKX0_BIOOC|nr:unnamed protein product [Clonostachys rosea]